MCDCRRVCVCVCVKEREDSFISSTNDDKKFNIFLLPRIFQREREREREEEEATANPTFLSQKHEKVMTITGTHMYDVLMWCGMISDSSIRRCDVGRTF